MGSWPGGRPVGRFYDGLAAMLNMLRMLSEFSAARKLGLTLMVVALSPAYLVKSVWTPMAAIGLFDV